jgi:ribosomal-protein-alanine N-acetyltransferase
MLVLALDTTTRGGSLALARDGGVLEVFEGDAARTHATRLPGDILDCLARHHVGLRDIDLYGVAVGPGSFTGLRIGIATIQGLAFANGRPVVGVSALDALVEAADPVTAAGAAEGGLRAAWMDARRGEVYGRLYRRQAGRWAAQGEPSVNSPAGTLAAWAAALAGAAVDFVGDGAAAHAGALEGVLPGGARVILPVPPLAAAIAGIAVRRRSEAGPPHRIRPLYVRRPDAELARERQRAPNTNSALPAGWIVEPMTAADLDEVLEIEAVSFTNPWSRPMFEQELLNPGVSHLHVMRTGDWRVAAFCMDWVVADEVHINNMAVRPECRGMGTGRALLATVLGRAAALGARRATLEVRRSNAVALKLYERLGFSVVAIRKEYYAHPVEDALILWRDELAPPAGAGGERAGQGAA